MLRVLSRTFTISTSVINVMTVLEITEMVRSLSQQVTIVTVAVSLLVSNVLYASRLCSGRIPSSTPYGTFLRHTRILAYHWKTIGFC